MFSSLFTASSLSVRDYCCGAQSKCVEEHKSKGAVGLLSESSLEKSPSRINDTNLTVTFTSSLLDVFA